jgi:diacylglycerol O-acyltransferase/trehalose O-mycolyltransferase
MPRRRSAALAGLAVLAAVLAALALRDGAAPTPTTTSSPPRAEVVDEQRIAPRLLDLTVRSPALAADAKVRLLLPQDWSRRSGGRRWPVLYLLHGCCDTYVSWTRSTGVERLAALRNVLVVMPDGGQVGFYSDWRGGTPRWETFHLRELLGILEREYGAGEPRSIAGVSMGGLGAMVYAARRPRRFRAAASFSGVLHPLRDTGVLLGLFGAFTPDPRAIWGEPESDRDIWARHDPTELAQELRGLRLFVSSGDGRPGRFDAPGQRSDPIERTVFGESRAFAARLRALGIRARADFYGAGQHRWRYWERELVRALPLLVEAP